MSNSNNKQEKITEPTDKHKELKERMARWDKFQRKHKIDTQVDAKDVFLKFLDEE
jgi:hypothetical protein